VEVRATSAASLSPPQYQKSSHIWNEIISSSFPIPFPLFLHGLKTPLHPLYIGNLSSTPIRGTHSIHPSRLHTAPRSPRPAAAGHGGHRGGRHRLVPPLAPRAASASKPHRGASGTALPRRRRRPRRIFVHRRLTSQFSAAPASPRPDGLRTHGEAPGSNGAEGVESSSGTSLTTTAAVAI
jgi:hypothetical protein